MDAELKMRGERRRPDALFRHGAQAGAYSSRRHGGSSQEPDAESASRFMKAYASARSAEGLPETKRSVGRRGHDEDFGQNLENLE